MIEFILSAMPKSKRNNLPVWFCTECVRIITLSFLVGTLIAVIMSRTMALADTFRTVTVEVIKEVPVYVSESDLDPIDGNTRKDAEEIAKVLYGMRNNPESDLRLITWVILNRVDNGLYPDSVQEVCTQPQQWVGYSEANPVTDELYQIALDEVTTWKTTGHRRIDMDYLWFDWSPKSITLKSEF